MKYIIILLLIIQAPVVAVADAIGTWRLYNCYSDIQQIQPAGDDVFVLASGNLYSYNTKDNSLTTYDKTTCLNSNDITRIAWVQQAKRLVIAYSNHSIDVLSLNQDVVNINDLADKQMSGDKTINDIYVSGKYAYLSTGFGIIKVNVADAYIVDTYNLGCKVDYCYIEGNNIYAASSTNGLLSAALNTNLLDKNVWSRVGDFTPKTIDTYTHDAHNNCYWGANADSQLTKYKKLDDGTFEQNTAFFPVKPDGPVSNDFWRLYKHNGKFFCTAGNYSYGLSADSYYKPGLVQVIDNGQWSKLEDPSSEYLTMPYSDANCIAFDPKNNAHFFVGSSSGLYEYREGKVVNRYDTSNSSMPGVGNKMTNAPIITSITYDGNNNLWVMNGWCDNFINCLQADGEWKTYSHPDYSYSNRFAIDHQGVFISKTNGYMWWVNNHHSSPCLYRYDYLHDDLKCYSVFTNQDGELLNLSSIPGVTEDLDGNIWVATSEGPLYLSREDSNSGVTFVQHKVPRYDGTNYADYLLDGVSIRCIKIDALNRKWLGTSENGVFLVSGDNNTQIYHFTTDNSPLFSNVIYDILIDNESGLVYFATLKGLCAFQSDITNDNSTTSGLSKDAVYAYPNPVTPEYTGMITIVGLLPDAQLKITNSSGQLVNEGICYGGSYQWDGCDISGKRVASGVYMVNITTSDGHSGVVAKVAIVR